MSIFLSFLLHLFFYFRISFGWLASSDWIIPPFADSFGGSLMRLSIPITASIESIEVAYAGLGHVELRVNGFKLGKKVLETAWSNYNKTCYYNVQVVNSESNLFQGNVYVGEEEHVKDSWVLNQSPNEIVFGVLLGNGMYHVADQPDRYTKFVGSFGPRSLKLEAIVTLTDGSTIHVTTGNPEQVWHCDPTGGPMTTSHTYGGEDWDERILIPGWDNVNSNSSFANWTPAKVWNGPGCSMLEQELEPIIVQEKLAVVATHTTPEGIVYDFGKNFAGWPAIVVSGSAGSSVQLVCGELLDNHGIPVQDGSPNYFKYTLSDLPIAFWSPRFSFYGFRWCTAIIKGNVTVHDIFGEFIYTNATVTGNFISSTQIFNSIHKIVLESYRSNFGSVWMDCPHREKLGWLESSHLLMPGMINNFNASKLLRKILRDIAEAQTTEGLIPDIAPEFTVFEGGFRDSPEWGSALIFNTEFLWKYYGDDSSIVQNYNGMKKYMNYLLSRANPEYILSYGLGDWCDGNIKVSGVCDPSGQLTRLGVTGTAILYGDAVRMSSFALYLNLASESEMWYNLSINVSKAFHKNYFYNTTAGYGSQTSNGMALALGVVPKEFQNCVLSALKHDIIKRGYVQTGGDIGHRFILLALMNARESDLLFRIHTNTIYPSYGYILSQGATSLPEQWDGGGSQLHSMLGQVEEWFYTLQLGIRCTFASCLIEPLPVSINDNSLDERGYYNSGACGLLDVTLRMKDEKLHLQLKITNHNNNICDGVTLKMPGDEIELTTIKDDGVWNFETKYSMKPIM